jgi:hypothetical protein
VTAIKGAGGTDLFLSVPYGDPTSGRFSATFHKSVFHALFRSLIGADKCCALPAVIYQI